MKVAILGLALMFTIAGCGKQLESFVSGVKPPSLDPVVTPPGSLDLEGKVGIKVSPGAVISKSANIGMKAGLTLSQRAVASDTLGARIGISRAPARF